MQKFSLRDAQFQSSHEMEDGLNPAYRSPFHYGGRTFSNCVQFFNAAKADYFDEGVIFERIMASSDAKEQERMGEIAEVDRSHIWTDEEYGVWMKAFYLKFTISEEAEALRQQLLATEDPVDLDIDQASNKRFVGSDSMRKALRTIRIKLKKESAKERQSLNKRLSHQDEERAAKKVKTRHLGSPVVADIMMQDAKALDMNPEGGRLTRPLTPITTAWEKGYTVQQLKQEMKARGKIAYSSLLKTELIAALKADDERIEEAKKRKRTKRPPSDIPLELGEISNLSKDELYQMARKFGVDDGECRLLDKSGLEDTCHRMIRVRDFVTSDIPYTKWPTRYLIEELTERRYQEANANNRQRMIEILREHDTWRIRFTDEVVVKH